jgi:hypothetical protein
MTWVWISYCLWFNTLSLLRNICSWYKLRSLFDYNYNVTYWYMYSHWGVFSIISWCFFVWKANLVQHNVVSTYEWITMGTYDKRRMLQLHRDIEAEWKQFIIMIQFILTLTDLIMWKQVYLKPKENWRYVHAHLTRWNAKQNIELLINLSLEMRSSGQPSHAIDSDKYFY